MLHGRHIVNSQTASRKLRKVCNFINFVEFNHIVEIAPRLKIN